MKNRKICIVTEARATYGYSRPVIRLIEGSPGLDLSLVVTGMHLLKEYGNTVEEIERDGFPIAAKVDMAMGGGSPTAWAKSLGVGIQSLAQVYDGLTPEIVLLFGDRAEVLAATVAAAYMNIPVGHVQSGDLSGHIDGSARHAITKLAHLHFPSCEDSAERVRRLGEEDWRIFNVGAPQLDEIIHGPRVDAGHLARTLRLDLNEPVLVVVQHPVLTEIDEARNQMIATMEVIEDLELQTVLIYPNVDAASEETIQVIHEYEHLPFVRTFRSLDRDLFVTLLDHASALIGNSSCGILEAPSFKLGVVNIGSRQRGRLQAPNVINVNHDRKEIAAAVERILGDEAFKRTLDRCVNPYGDGRSAERIVRVLSDIDIGGPLLHKTMTY